MRLWWCLVALAVVLSSSQVLSQEEDEDFDMGDEADIEDEPEPEAVKEKVIVQYVPPRAKGPTHFHDAFLDASAIGKRY